MRGSTALRKVAAVAMAVMLVTAGVTMINPHTEQDLDPVGEADAVAPAVALAGVAGASVATGVATWTVARLTAETDPAEKEETIQTKIDLYQTGKQQEAVRENTKNIAGNSVRNTDVKMQIEGIQALDDAADRDMSRSEAKAYVASVLDNRTTTKQWNAYNVWSAAALSVKYAENRSTVAPNIADSFASSTGEITTYNNVISDYGQDLIDASYEVDNSASDWNTTKTLANGTVHNVTRIPLEVQENGAGESYVSKVRDETATVWTTPTSPGGQVTFGVEDDSTGEREEYTITVAMSDYRIQRNQSDDADAVLSDDGPAVIADVDTWANYLDQIEAQNNKVTQTVHTIADNNYAEIKAGEIDLPTTNPYFASEQYAADGTSRDAFLASYYSSLGIGNAENWEDIQQTTISTEDGGYYPGHVLYDGDPIGGDGPMTFNESETYNASELPGDVIVTTPTGRETITSGNFTVEEINGTDGADPTSITFESDDDLSASNLTEFREAVEWINEQQAESEAREEKQENSAGGGVDIPDEVGGFDLGTIMIALFGLAAAGIAARFVSQ